MPQYVIERDLPGAGQLSADELQELARTSNGIIEGLAPGITWERSYVTGDKLYCVYTATNAEIVREHASRGGFAADRIEEVIAVIDPGTAG